MTRNLNVKHQINKMPIQLFIVGIHSSVIVVGWYTNNISTTKGKNKSIGNDTLITNTVISCC